MSNYSKSDEALSKLDKTQYWVTQESGTEPPGTGSSWYFEKALNGGWIAA